MKIAHIVGARPQFIKAAAVCRATRHFEQIEDMVVHTGQHFDANMSTVFFDELEMGTPAFNLDIHGGTHGVMTGRMLERLEAVLTQEQPDWVIVYGDTNSTLAGAIAAAKLHIPIAHVEAGLRSFNRRMPEEINRILTDHAATLLLSPTDTATRNLRHEGVTEAAIAQVGDVMYDATLFSGVNAEHSSTILQNLGLTGNRYCLATVHRQENTDDAARLESIFRALSAVSRELPVVIPLHPRTRKRLAEYNLSHVLDDLTICSPVGFLDMAMLLKHASLVATDSGGIQKEAYFHGVPCVTLRDETEWTELVDMGWNRIVPPGSADIHRQILSMVGHKGADGAPYGDGEAGRKICQALISRA